MNIPHAAKQLSPGTTSTEPGTEARAPESPCSTTREEPPLSASREKPTQQQRPSTAKNKQVNKTIFLKRTYPSL